MIRDVFSQPHQAMVMLFFGLVGGLGYELVRLPRLRVGRVGSVFRDLSTLLWLQICLVAGLCPISLFYLFPIRYTRESISVSP